MQSVIEFQSVSKKFENKLLLEEVSFKLNQGEITTLIGQNGTGKTTIAKIMLGLEKPDQGKVIVKSKLRIGYTPQKFNFNFNMPLTGKGLLEILAPNGINAEILKLTNFIDFDSLKKTDVSELSGGQLQKLILVGTLVNNPDFIILDEPMQYLDAISQQEFYKSLNQIKAQFGLTVFIISHDLFTVMKNSDQVICINRHICCIGKPTEIEKNLEFKNALSEIGVYIHSHDHKHE